MDDMTDYPSDEHFNLARELGEDLLKRVAGMIDLLARVDQ